MKKKIQLPNKPIISTKHPFLQVPVLRVEDEEVEITARKRGPLDMTFKIEARGLSDQAIAGCLYASCLPFNLVRSPYWKDMVETINKAPTDYTSPRCEKVRTTLLQKEKTSLERSL